MILEWLCTRFGLVSGFIGHLQNVTTNNLWQSDCNHSTHTVFSVCYVFTSHYLWWIPTVSSASVPTFLLDGDCLTTKSLLQLPTLKSKSKSYYNWRSIGQSVLVSSHICGQRPDFYYSQLTVLLITSQDRPQRKHNSSVAVQTCLFAKPLFSNCSCIFAYLIVIAQQQVYMPQYILYDWLVYRVYIYNMGLYIP
jgi:hypothetical protein